MGEEKRRRQAGTFRDVYEKKYMGANGTLISASGVGFCWCSKEDYPELVKLMPDMMVSYDEWEKKATRMLAEVRGQVGEENVVLAHINLSEFIPWAKSRGLPLNSMTRQQYATWIALAKTEKGLH